VSTATHSTDQAPGAVRSGPASQTPSFVWGTPVFFDELDAMGMLHNSRYALLLERTSSAFFESNGWRWDLDPAKNPDAHHVVVEQSIRYLTPIRGTTEVAVDMWVERLGRTSAAYGFEVRSVDSTVTHARAQRITVKLDPVTFQPVEWTPRLRRCLASLVRDGDR
jgi:acyl-CoA thioester hydrolase